MIRLPPRYTRTDTPYTTRVRSRDVAHRTGWRRPARGGADPGQRVCRGHRAQRYLARAAGHCILTDRDRTAGRRASIAAERDGGLPLCHAVGADRPGGETRRAVFPAARDGAPPGCVIVIAARYPAVARGDIAHPVFVRPTAGPRCCHLIQPTH